MKQEMHQLFAAVKAKDVARFGEILRQSKELDLDEVSSEWGDRTLLIYAADFGCLEIMERLVKKGADVNVGNDTGFTALMSASHPRRGNLSVVKFLLENGAEIDLSNNNGWTALIMAARGNHVEIARLLIDNGANLHLGSKDDNGQEDWLPLVHAADCNSIETAELLLQRGAHIDDCGTDGTTALMMASGLGHLDMVRLLLRHGADVNRSMHTEGSTALIGASCAGHVEIVELLVAHGADINMATRDGFTATKVAFQAEKTDVIDCLKRLKQKQISTLGNTKQVPDQTPVSASQNHLPSKISNMVIDVNKDISPPTDSGSPFLKINFAGYIVFLILAVLLDLAGFMFMIVNDLKGMTLILAGAVVFLSIAFMNEKAIRRLLFVNNQKEAISKEIKKTLKTSPLRLKK